MPLTGAAKRDYMRDYMRERRAPQVAQHAAEREAVRDQKLIKQIAYWVRRAHLHRRRSKLADRVLAGLDLSTEVGCQEALDRYKRLLAEREEERNRPPPPPLIRYCFNCMRDANEVRLAGAFGHYICRSCAVECIALLDAAEGRSPPGPGS